MNSQTLKKWTPRAFAILLACVMLVCALIDSKIPEAVEEASYIKKLDSIVTNYENYLNSSLLYKLPESVGDNDTVSLIVKLGAPTLLDTYEYAGKTMSFSEYSASEAGDIHRDHVESEKQALLAALDEGGIEHEAGASYSTVLSGFEILIKAKDYKATCELLPSDATPIVGESYMPAETELVENTVNVYETGIFDSSAFKYDGTGMVVAVLDTGLDYTHSAFSTENFDNSDLGLTKAEVESVLSSTNASKLLSGLLSDDVYENDKVPFAFDYADEDADVYSLHNNHGTHVSGVIVGDDDTITGVAPNAQLVSMKIFSDVQDTARTSWILSALEDCVTLGVDVINMSLGTACGFSTENDKELISGVYQDIRDKGISLVVAASNSFSSAYGSEKNGNLGLTSNPDTSTVGSPSTYDGAISIASINGEKTPYMLYNNSILYFVEATDSGAEEKDFVDEILPEGTDSMDVPFVLVPGAGRPADYTGMDVKGKIVLVRRGSNTFEDKANAAQNAGALGIIIYNNVSGDIKMNAGITTIPICSISQDDGEKLAAAGEGTLSISRAQKSGPFMSDFSSWGPTPDLRIKPEITAHGGNILSAITGGGYDRLSGTSMACPNMSGVIALMRQYVISEFPDEYKTTNGQIDYVKVNAIVNRLLMSTADIVYNKNGLPYAVRKQGAGLANLASAASTGAYILTYDRDDGSVMDKTKIELGDDPTRSGVYTLSFSIDNFGSTTLTYDLSAYVMTEGVSGTKTHKGDTAVTEEGYILSGASVVISSVSGATQNGNALTVPAGTKADVTVTVTLSDSDKQYLDSSFENGMYVEGFITLTAKEGTEISLSTPFLAFYGDWTEAPLFDIDYYETNADELDDSIETLDKTLPDAYATRPIGGVESDFVSYLGSYYFVQNPTDKVISAKREYIALSNTEGTVHTLRFVWAGLLRSAKRIDITITDDSTGEVIFEAVEHDVRKSYGDGGSTIYPANVEIDFDVAEHNLKNNTKFTVKLVGYLDYGDGGTDTNKNCTFEFPFTTDFEAPAVTDCEYYTEYDKDAKKTRLFAKIAVYDNHYAMSMQTGYITKDATGSYMLTPFESYLTPIYSECNSTTYVTYELTDFIYDIKNNAAHKNTFVVSCYDYALNEATYEIPLPDEFIDFYLEDETVTLSPNEVYTLTPLVYPNTEWPELLAYTSANTDVVRIVNNKMVAVAPGKTSIIIYDPENPDVETILPVTVLSENDEGYQQFDKPVADVFELQGFETLKAYYFVSHSDRDIATTGDITMFADRGMSLSLYPSESVSLFYKLDAYFPDDTEVVFSSGNSKIVSVDENGVIVANQEGFSSVTVRVQLDGKNTYYSETIDIEVKDPYVTTGPSLTHYFGNGGIVNIPDDLLLNEIGSYAFSNYDYIDKDENDIISDEEPDLTKIWYLGDDTITKVIIPEGVKKIGAYAFANLTALEEVVLPSTLEQIEYGAFYGCSSLTTLTGIEHVKLINNSAFFGCDVSGTVSFDSACAIGDYAFASNVNLKEIILPSTLQSIGSYAFAADEGLTGVVSHADRVKYGPYAFTGCSSLEEISINTAVIPAGAFYNCSSLSKVNIGKDVAAIGEYAFAGTKLSSFGLDEANSALKLNAEKNMIFSADGSTLLLVSPTASGSLTLNDSSVTTVGVGAFAGNKKITKVSIPSVKQVKDYAFADCVSLASVSLGTLEEIGNYAFFNIPLTSHPSFEKLSELGKYSFAYTDITEVSIPAGMNVGEGAFNECQSLAKVTIGDGAVIGEGAFMLGRNAEHERTGKDNYVFKFYVENGERVYYYEYLSALTELTIGDNVELGKSAFMGAAKLETVTLGKGVSIGEMAFYSACSLKNIDLSEVVEIGVLAFSGDVTYIYSDNNANLPVVKDDLYVYRYYTPVFTSVDLSSISTLGNEAFRYCKHLESVSLGSLSEVPYMAFADCDMLSSVDLSGVTFVGEGAFSATALTEVDLSAASMIDEYAFVNCFELALVTLNPEGADIGEGAFAYCEALTKVENLNAVKNIADYAFGYTALTEADLSGAVSIGDSVFIKKTLTPFKITLGSSLESIGDNPFAMCELAPFSSLRYESFNGKEYPYVIYDYDISDTVKVINGSLYCKVPYGYELITYCANGNEKNVTVADGTVRVTAMAFAGSGVIRVTLPHSLNAIGHKAFFDCDRLLSVVFRSYEAPVLEEEFDQSYHDSYENIPATGKYDFTVYDGSLSSEMGLEIVPYYMWNAASDKYSNVYYGANFIDYIGHIAAPITMTAPSNGIGYDTFILGQYFDVRIDGAAAADDITMAAIEAINSIPENPTLEHEALVVAARAAYDRIATTEQQALVYNYSVLLSAEKRIEAFKNSMTEEPEDVEPPVSEPESELDWKLIVVISESALILAAVILLAVLLIVKKAKKSKKQADAEPTEQDGAEQPEETEEAETTEGSEETDENKEENQAEDEDQD